MPNPSYVRTVLRRTGTSPLHLGLRLLVARGNIASVLWLDGDFRRLHQQLVEDSPSSDADSILPADSRYHRQSVAKIALPQVPRSSGI